jgi:hypothetical protein
VVYEKLYNSYSLPYNCNVQDIQVVFKGAITQKIIVELGNSVRDKLANEKQIRKVFPVFVELAQNIERYSAIREQNEVEGIKSGVGVILISKINYCYHVSSGNVVENERCGKIRSKLEYINFLNSDELKSFYIKSRKARPDSDSKGAGIGFIEIARKSGSALDFRIIEIDDKYSFLTISVKIKKEK